MATRAVSTTVHYRAWDTSANTPKTGDLANHTLRWIKDGTSAATTASPTEVDATNAPGVYQVVLTSTETDCTFGSLAGKSSTANIQIFGISIGFEYSAGAAFPTNFGSLSIDGSGRVDVAKIAGATQTASDLGILNSANGIETGMSLAQAQRLQSSVLLGKVSGLPALPIFRSADDSANRVSAVTDTNGNRSAVTLNP